MEISVCRSESESDMVVFSFLLFFPLGLFFLCCYLFVLLREKLE